MLGKRGGKVPGSVWGKGAWLGRDRLQCRAGMGVECRRVSCVEGKGAQREWGGPPRAWGREGEDGSGAPAERLKLGLVLRGRKRVDGIPWKSGGEVLGRVGPVRVRGAWRRAGTPCPPSVRGGCVGAGEGRPEGMAGDTGGLGPCGEGVRGILGDRFKVGFGGCCGGGGFCCWFLVFGWLL